MYEDDPALGTIVGKRHVAVFFRAHASDCEVIRALCATGGDLVHFFPRAGLGTILFPWVQTREELYAALEALSVLRVVSAAAPDVGLSAPEH